MTIYHLSLNHWPSTVRPSTICPCTKWPFIICLSPFPSTYYLHIPLLNAPLSYGPPQYVPPESAWEPFFPPPWGPPPEIAIHGILHVLSVGLLYVSIIPHIDYSERTVLCTVSVTTAVLSLEVGARSLTPLAICTGDAPMRAN
jgi:hypothetical protein